MLTHTAGTDDRAQRARDPSLLADHLAEIVLHATWAKHDGVSLVEAARKPRLPPSGLVDTSCRAQVLEENNHSALRF
jgi:hypothetical protein